MLRAEHLGFGYRADERVIADCSVDFPAGQVTAITGPSGRGKSTLLYLLGLMLRPDHGSVSWQGRPVSALSDADRTRLRATSFGFVFQDAALDQTRSVLDNICETALYRGQSRTTARARARELMDRFGVSLRAEHRPGEISGGQAQRVALCRALLASPAVLLADEPTGSLDPESADVVVSALCDAARAGAAVVIATHDPRVVERVDAVVRL